MKPTLRLSTCLLALLAAATAASAADLVVYDDALQNGFEDWSWASHGLTNTTPSVGSFSIWMEPDAWAGVYLHSATPIAVTEHDAVRFYIHGGSGGGQLLRLVLQLGTTIVAELPLDPAPAGDWQQRTVTCADMGLASGTFDGLIFQDRSGVDQDQVFLDQIELLENTTPPPPPVPLTIQVDPNRDRRPVSPLIYGVNFGDPAQLDDPGFTLRRWGGNSTSRYNWRADISNRGSDWFFMNIPNAVADPAQLPHGSEADVFIGATLAAGAEPIVTLPMIGWVPVDERVKRWSFSVATYGPQLVTECSYFAEPPAWCQPDAGDGTCNPVLNTTGYCPTGGLIVGNDPTDTSQVATSSWVTDWMAHIASREGSAAAGGPRLWALDNEPMLWNSTHRDVFPEPLTYDQIWNLTVQYAGAVKAQDPEAKVLGPVVWGWCAFFSSAADAAYPNGSCVDGPDRQAHGGLPFIDWYLQKVCLHEAQTGIRLIDYLDVHFYPQGGVAGLGSSSSEDPTTAARRLRSVKELYDPDHVSESWIGQPVALIPRLRQWIDSACPGIGIALTEYKWGADNGPSGALAQAEVLAILGREGVDLATRWVAPEPGSLTEDIFRLYLNYDGEGARITGDSVWANSGDVDAVGAYAVRGDAETPLYLLLFNKDTAPRTAEVHTSVALKPTAQVYRWDATNPLSWVAEITPDVGGFDIDLPPRSATLVVAPLDLTRLFSDDFESGDTEGWSSTVP